ncbi:MAG: class I SAM-dependent methyltransferase [Steroidobacter sp.]
MLTTQDMINQLTWTTPGAIRELDYNSDYTDAGERAALAFVRNDITGTPILDIGVGTGRTIGLLKPLSSDYRGIDYLQSMVELSRRRYPDATIELGDARNLPEMPADHFGFVQFSYNGIDSVSAHDRKQVLANVYRVLVNNGLFLFSTLNMNGPIPKQRPWHMFLPQAPDPLRFAVRFARMLLWKPVEVLRWYKLRKHQENGAGFLVAPLPAHHWSILAHYTSIERQVDELEQNGFAVVCIFSSEPGNVVLPGDDTSGIDYFHVVARKLRM